MSLLFIVASVSSEIEKYGAYAGLGAIVGLGVLSLLYFSQAREVKRLREWAGRAPERAAELEQRVQADAQRRVVAQPMRPAAQTAAGQQAAAPPPARPGVPAPAGTAPATAAAQARPVPPGLPGTPAPQPAGATAAAPVAPGAPSTPATPGGPAAPPAPGSLVTPGVPAAVPAAASTATRAVPAPATGTEGASNGSAGQETRESVAARPEPLVAPRPAAPPRPLPSARDHMTSASGRREHDARWSSRFTMMVVGGMAAVLVIGVVALTQLGGDGQPASQTTIGAAPLPESPAQAPTRDPGTRTAPVDRRATVVAVLNGTTQTGLARGVADKLEESGFTIGTVGNDADQARSATIVSYTAGNRRAADTVAQIIGVSRRDAVVAIDRNTAVAAGDAKVVVTVGADRIE